MKKIILLLSFTLLGAILFGCQSANETPKPDSELPKDNGALFVDRKIIEVIVSESNRSSLTASENEDFIESFKTILSSAVKMPGIANMADPEYFIEVVYKNESKQRYNLWIGHIGEKSTLMKSDETHTIYTLSDEMTDKLISLVGEPLLSSRN
ncbi:hypothetical protein [Fredinandcohnia sp. 179-A 10B2 NHS]|uniref:hypothetical protein n=1 Tax=Fredinandcohnia sp. 179-A 10B2 NHS TaxID=3235176 RepID=UPI0039A28272